MYPDPKRETFVEFPSLSGSRSTSRSSIVEEEFDLEVSAAREYVNNFLEYAWAELEEDFLVLSFLPLPTEMLARMPSHAMAAASSGGPLVNFRELEERAPVHRVVLGVCTFGDEEGKRETRRILDNLRNVQHTKIFVALLMPGGQEPPVEQFDAIMDHHNQLIKMGVDDVLIHPEISAGSLRQAVELMYTSHVCNAHSMREMIQNHLHSGKWVLQSYLERLRQQEQKLLWHDIPQTLMPGFGLPDRRLREHESGVGQYVFQEPYIENGRVFAATNRDQVKVAVKVIEKSQVHHPDTIECIWRELQIPRKIGVHPNIVRCVETLNATINYYMVFPDCGNLNLEQYCAQQQQQRLDENVALNCLKQVANALAWVHGQGFAHRLVSLHHVVVKEGDPLHFTLIDFRHAVRAPLDDRDLASGAHFGTLPCIAPEVAFGHAYSPCLADSWSLGVLVLEMSGGLTSLTTTAKAYKEAQQQARAQTSEERQPAAAAPDPNTEEAEVEAEEDEEEDLAEDAELEPHGPLQDEDSMLMRDIVDFFYTTRCHERALGMINGVNSPRLLFYIRRMLLVSPQQRMRIQEVPRFLE